MNYFFEVFKKYTIFSGRARRAEYWYFLLFNTIFSFATLILGIILGKGIILCIIYTLVMIVPNWAVTVRRLHDVGKSGWMIFINLIPFAGAIWFLILTVIDSQPGDNEYGSNPKGIASVPPAQATIQA